MNQESVSKAALSNHPRTPSAWDALGEFSVTPRSLLITMLAVPIGLVAACFSLLLLRLIGLFTNLFYFGRLSTALTSPSGTPPRTCSRSAPVVFGAAVGTRLTHVTVTRPDCDANTRSACGE